MTYKQAVKEAKAGKKVARKEWGQWHFVTFENGYLIMNDPMNGQPNLLRQWMFEPTEDDTKKRDWEILEAIRQWR